LIAVDVISAFLLATLSEEIYITIPEGYPGKFKAGQVLKLNKSLYGLKQAPYEWHKVIHEHLLTLGFTPFISERCVYRGKFSNKICFILLYIDDMAFGTPDRQTMSLLKEAVHKSYPITDRGPINFFLNINIIRDRRPKQ
jgi:ATP-binding cassette subfamily B (MDR/TAP) protein 1